MKISGRFRIDRVPTEPYSIDMTKKQAYAKAAAWRLAVDEGRVVRYGYPETVGMYMSEFKTVAEAQAAVVDADCNEVQIVVRPPTV